MSSDSDSHPLHQQALSLAKEYKRLESEIIKVLQQIDDGKIYRSLGFSSLFEYTTKALGFTEAVSYGFITVSRSARKIPLLQEAISQGQITVNSAKRITSVLTIVNAPILLEKAKNMTQRE